MRSHLQGNRVLILVFFVFCLLVTNAWFSWAAGIQYLSVADSRSYLIIANSAPHLPSTVIDYQHAQRVVPHYLIGLFSHLTQLSLPVSYYIFLALIIFCILYVFDKILCQFELCISGYSICAALFIFSPYVFRYYFVVPVMLADLVFVLGTALALYGLLSTKFSFCLIGILIGAAGRQNVILMLPGTATWILYSAEWRSKFKPAQLNLRLILLVSLVCSYFYFIGKLINGFAGTPMPISMIVSLPAWFVSSDFNWDLFFEHLLRSLCPFSAHFAAFMALISSCNLVDKAKYWSLLLIAAGLSSLAVLSNPILAQQSEARYTGMGVLPAVLLLALMIEKNKAPLRKIQISRLTMLIVVLFLGSFHHKYSVFPSTSINTFAFSTILSSLGVFIFLRKIASSL